MSPKFYQAGMDTSTRPCPSRDALYNVGDVVLQRENMGLWWMSPEPFPDNRRSDFEIHDRDAVVLQGICIVASSDGSWDVGDMTAFDVNDDYDDSTEVIGHCETFEHARAIAALAGLEGFGHGGS